MCFTLIKGTFHVKGYSPDGDSIKFKAKTKANWLKIRGNVKLNSKSHAQLRFESIDTLETHYKRRHQPDRFAHGAMYSLLDELGITDVKWNSNMTRVTQAKDGAQGYILCREVERYGRPVAFAFKGDTDLKDGSSVWFDDQLLKQSMNYHLVKEGMAYVTYYSGLFDDLRSTMTSGYIDAKNGQKGLHAEDRTESGFTVRGINSLQKDHVILPKLFRRLVSHIDSGGFMRNFKSELAVNPEKVLLVNRGHFINFHNLVDVSGNEVKLNHPIEDVVFVG